MRTSAAGGAPRRRATASAARRPVAPSARARDVHVVRGDAAGRAGAGDVANVDAQLARQLARGGRGQHCPRRRAPTPSSRQRRAAARARRRAAGAAVAAASRRRRLPAARLLRLRTRRWRSAPCRPGRSAPRRTCACATRPARGDGISTVALSVIISTIGWSSRSASPSLTSQLHDLALDDAFADVGQLELVGHRSLAPRSSRRARPRPGCGRRRAGTRAPACTGTACRSR